MLNIYNLVQSQYTVDKVIRQMQLFKKKYIVISFHTINSHEVHVKSRLYICVNFLIIMWNYISLDEGKHE